MIEVEIPDSEFFNNETGEFYNFKKRTLHLEHSLISLTRWEQKYKRPYLSEKTGPRNLEETLYYFWCMTIEKGVPVWAFNNISRKDYQRILDHIEDDMTATKITDRRQNKRGGRSQIMTSEVIYSYMAEFNLPFDYCSKWHLSNLLMLIRVCSAQNSPGKMSKTETLMNYAVLNKANKAKFHTKG